MKRIKDFLSREIDKVDWIILSVLLVFCFFLFVHADVIVTGNRSFLMYTSLTDFYKACHEWTQNWGANYLPSTFWIFALWNFPLFLGGYFPENRVTNCVPVTLWFKLLPVLFYIVSAFVVYRIAQSIGMEKSKAKMCMFAFAAAPVALYSQFVFSQYDILTVFFMLLGLYFFYNDKRGRFILFFGIAMTFKYHALIYFLVLLVLIEKRIWKLIYSTVLVCLPFVLEVLLYYHSPHFRRSVFGFSSLDVADVSFPWPYTVADINLMLLVVLVMFIIAYICPSDKKNVVKWSIFLLNGVNFAFFGCMNWNPQWLLIGMPFLILAIFVNQNCELLLLLQMIFSIAVWYVLAIVWNGVLDVELLKNGVLKEFLSGTDFLSKPADIYPSISKSYIYTVFLVVFGAFMLLSIPRRQLEERRYKTPQMLLYLRCTYCVAFLFLFIPMIPSVVDAFDNKVYFLEAETIEGSMVPVEISKNTKIEQYFISDGYEIDEIEIFVGTYGRTNTSSLYITLEEENGNVLYKDTVQCVELQTDNEWYTILKGPIEVEPYERYRLTIMSDAEKNNSIALYINKVYSGNENAIIYQNRKEVQYGQIRLQIIGDVYSNESGERALSVAKYEGPIYGGTEVAQTINGLDTKVDSMHVYFGTYMDEIDSDLYYKLVNKKNEEVLIEDRIDTTKIEDNEYFFIRFSETVYLDEADTYELIFYSNNAVLGNAVSIGTKDEHLNVILYGK